MALLNSIVNIFAAVSPVAPNNHLWHWFILEVFTFIADYGWRIVVFTLLLKLVLSPLDFYQRYKMHKNQKITERLKPTMEKLQKQYGDNKQVFSQKQMELNRKEGYSYFSSCLPMILTMVIFITLWIAMTAVGRYKTLNEYTTLYNYYNNVYDQLRDTPLEDRVMPVGQDVAFTLYYDGIDDDYINGYTDPETGEHVQGLRERFGLPDSFTLENHEKVQSSFLWINNIWAPDVPWGNKAIMSYTDFEKAIGDYAKPEVSKIPNISEVLAIYDKVMGKLLSDTTHSHQNGYLILPILVVLLSVGSQLLTTHQQKKAGQVNAKGGAGMSMKIMMFLMPVMMAVFAVQYASIFTLYMVTNSAVTLVLNFSFTGIIDFADKRKRRRNYGISVGSPRATMSYKNSPIIHYIKGANPDAGKREVAPEPAADIPVDTSTADAPAKGGFFGRLFGGKKNKADSNGGRPSPKASGRPDPNELMNIDMSSSNSKKKKKK